MNNDDLCFYIILFLAAFFTVAITVLICWEG